MTRLSMRIADPFMSHLAAPALAPTAAAEPPCLREGPPTPYGTAEAQTPLWIKKPTAQPDQPWILRRRDGIEIILERKLRLGTAEDNDWVLHDSYVSQHHALLTASEDRVLVQDCGSRNGTFVNGVRLQKGELLDGGVLRLGETELWLARKPQPHSMGLVGVSPQMLAVRKQIARVAPSSLPVLILGESGTGKELVAKAIHEASQRNGPLVPINCGALPRELIESELFGHERGAFTGADRKHLGCFAEAAGGTLFLDEVGELPIELQPRLLRALETQKIRPVGSTREVSVDVRIVAATHRNLPQAVADGRFRADLYYRLAGLVIDLPPLRERPTDIPLLVLHFLTEVAVQHPGLHIDDDQIQAIMQAPWLGNVRELRMALLRAAHLHGPTLRARDIIGQQKPLPSSSDSQVQVVGRRLVDIERDVLAQVLRHSGGNQRTAALVLDVPKSSLADRLRRHGIFTSREVRVDSPTAKEPKRGTMT
ncbi:MAG TPA: sigma 54-interacting transcriptional regulator [Pseudomonadota bacterium]|nr:sigma 54-interacting transcriptional regulator [Pseudomonadota bacterium]